jgi:archaellum component FlaC
MHVATTRRKKGNGHDSELARGFAVVVEEMRGHFKVFGEQLSLQGDRLTRVEEKLTGLDEKVTRLDEKVTGLDQRMERVEHRLGLVEVAVLEVGREVKRKVDRDDVEAIVEGVLARKARR